MVNEIEIFGDVDFVEKDTYAKWTGSDRTHNNEIVLKKNKVYDVIVHQNGRVIFDLGHALYGWVRPENFEIINVTGELDYENGTLH